MAFHPYPQLIPSVFNLSGFAPPQSLTSASHWPWVDHPASGPEHATHTLVRIRFRYGSPHSWLTTQHATDSQAHSSKGTPPPHNKQGAMTDYQHMVSGTLSLPSRGTFHHSLTVLIHYRSPRVFSLDKWSCHLHTGFHEPRATPEHTQTAAAISATGLSPTPAGLPRPFAYPDGFSLPGRTPARPQACPQHRARTARRLHTRTRFRLLRLRSPLLTEYPLQQVLRCFTSPRSHPRAMNFTHGRPGTTPARFPHSDTPGSPLACQLPEAYRRLPRPSSALDAQASTERPAHTQQTRPAPQGKARKDARIRYTIPKHHTHPHRQAQAQSPTA